MIGWRQRPAQFAAKRFSGSKGSSTKVESALAWSVALIGMGVFIMCSREQLEAGLKSIVRKFVDPSFDEWIDQHGYRTFVRGISKDMMKLRYLHTEYENERRRRAVEGDGSGGAHDE